MNNGVGLAAIENYQTKNNEETYVKFMLRILNRSLKIAINMFETENMSVKSELLTISKYAKYKGVPTSTIRYWVEIDKINQQVIQMQGICCLKRIDILSSSNANLHN